MVEGVEVMTKELPDEVSISQEVLTQEIGGESVLLDLESEQYFGLNRVGTRIWQLLSEGMQLEDLVQQLLTEFDAPEDKLRSDIKSLMVDLLDSGLIKTD